MYGGVNWYQYLFTSSHGAEMITTKEDALVEAMVRAIVSPSDEEAEESNKLAIEIARNMTIGEVKECQQRAIKLVEMKKELDQIINRVMNKDQLH